MTVAQFEEVRDKVGEILIDVLGLDEDYEISPEDNLVSDLAAESIDFVDIAFSLEQEFGKKINPGDIFPGFLREVEIFDNNEKILPTVASRLKDEYPHIEETLIRKFEDSQDPEVFFLVDVIAKFVAA